MAILFATYWDVVENKEKEYEDFILGKYIPTMEKTGLRITGAFYVVVGAGPRIVSVSTTDDPAMFQKAMTSEEYRELLEGYSPLSGTIPAGCTNRTGHPRQAIRDAGRRLEIQPVLQYPPRHGKGYRKFLETEFIPSHGKARHKGDKHMEWP